LSGEKKQHKKVFIGHGRQKKKREGAAQARETVFRVGVKGGKMTNGKKEGTKVKSALGSRLKRGGG